LSVVLIVISGTFKLLFEVQKVVMKTQYVVVSNSTDIW